MPDEFTPGPQFDTMRLCGRDHEGRPVMWFCGREGGTPVELEAAQVRGGVLFWMAMHADPVAFRSGVTMVIDVSRTNAGPRVGNERKLQRAWQSLKLRPQHLFIVGASFLRRLFINGLIRFASFFTRSKAAERVRFVDMDVVRGVVPPESFPADLGGHARIPVRDWVAARLRAWEVPAGADSPGERPGSDA